MPQNRTEKIIQQFAENPAGKIHSGDFVNIVPGYIMTHDNSAAVIKKFNSLNLNHIFNPRQVVFTLDHNIQDTSEKNQAKYRAIEAFAQKHDIDFYPAGRGIGHQVMCEEGYAWPDTFVVASDSHSNMYGGLGCLGTPIVRSDAAAAWATGRIWWQVPPVTKVILKGELQKGVSGKDVIITLAGFFKNDEVLNHTLEFDGSGIGQLSIDQRLTIANMSTEWGALAALFPVDDQTITWLDSRRKLAGKRDSTSKTRLRKERIKALIENGIKADKDARYASEIELDLTSISPHISGPNSVKVMTPLSRISRERIKIQKAYLLSCVNARVEDLAEAAAVIDGNKVHKDVEFYIAAASSDVQQESERRGDWKKLLDAGAIALPPGCGPCIGLGAGTLKDGETGISATNRNFKGRMGSRDARAYLASPAVVAASAIHGEICGPHSFPENEVRATLRKGQLAPAEQTQIISGFPEKIAGRAWFLNADNINTDMLYPSQYTYLEDMTDEEMKAVILQDYDPQLAAKIKPRDILVAGLNFGCGSSREQAATALKIAGVQLVLAASFSATYKRNAFNNGFLVLECPQLIEKLREKSRAEAGLLGSGLTVDFKNAWVEYDDSRFPFLVPGTVGQQLVLDGGLIAQVKK